jgi:apolipoprotein N-acyltransferase
MKINYRKIFYFFLAIVLSAVAYFFSSGINGWGGWLMWLAPLPVLLCALYFGGLLAFVASFLAYFLGNALAIQYLSGLAPTMLKPYFPVHAFIIGVLGDAIIFAFLIVISSWIMKRLKHWISILFFPIAWTVYEYSIATISSVGTNGSIAYSQIHWLTLIQIASITGIWGITFLLILVPTTIAFAWYYRQQKLRAIIVLSITAILMFASLLWGWIALAEKYTNTIKVGLAATNATVTDLKTTNPKEVFAEVDRYIDLIRQLANQGATIILLPEKIVSTKNNYLSDILNKFSQTAKQLHITIIVGLNQIDAKRNTAFVFNEQGKIAVDYDKQHLVTFSSEAVYKPGKQLGLFTHQNNVYGVAICHDMDFQRLGHDYGKADAKIVFVPALDFVADNWLHARVAIMQGVENGYAVVRTAQWGLLTVSDSHGRIIAARKTSLTTPVGFVADVPVR